MSCFSCVIILLVKAGASLGLTHVSEACRAPRAGGTLPPQAHPPASQGSSAQTFARLKTPQNLSSPPHPPTPLPWQGLNHPYLRHTPSLWPLPLPWQKQVPSGHGGGTRDACVIDHLAFSPSLSPESLSRTPELLAQGPVSLPTPEKHPRALRQSPIPTPSLRIILYSSFQTVQYSLGYPIIIK